MAGSRAAIFGRFIEDLDESELGFGEKQVVYEVLLDLIEEFDIKGIDNYLNIDASFDDVYYNRYPELEEEEE